RSPAMSSRSRVTRLSSLESSSRRRRVSGGALGARATRCTLRGLLPPALRMRPDPCARSGLLEAGAQRVHQVDDLRRPVGFLCLDLLALRLCFDDVAQLLLVVVVVA